MKVVGSAVFIRREKTGGCNTWGDYQLVNIPGLSPIVLLLVFARGESEQEREREGRRDVNPLTRGAIGSMARPWEGGMWQPEPPCAALCPE